MVANWHNDVNWWLFSLMTKQCKKIMDMHEYRQCIHLTWQMANFTKLTSLSNVPCILLLNKPKEEEDSMGYMHSIGMSTLMCLSISNNTEQLCYLCHYFRLLDKTLL